MSLEFDIISKYFKSAVHTNLTLGIGDDCALLTTPADTQIAISTDTYSEGTHFLKNAKAKDIGYKALAVNLSDLAACGADPQFVSLALSLPDINEAWIKNFSDGFNELINQYSMTLIGGDLTKGPLSITCTVQGFVPSDRALLRSGAKPGDCIGLTGKTGLAATGLSELKNNPNKESEYTNAFHRPTPRIESGLLLRDIATSCIDLSDGLYQDLQHILNASNVGAEIFCKRLNQDLDLNTVLTGGEDYELCFTYPSGSTPKLDCEWTHIGNITDTSELTLLNQGKPYFLDDQTFQHF